MKNKTLLTLSLAAALSTIFSPTLTALAENNSNSVTVLYLQNEEISPRYSYIEGGDIGVYPSSSGTTYELNIQGISSVTSISGTATLYKKNTSGRYTKIASEKLSFSGREVSYTGHLKSDGSGTYKITFSGKVNSTAGSESITFSNTNSY